MTSHVQEQPGVAVPGPGAGAAPGQGFTRLPDLASPTNLIIPGLARLMGEGWETARRRDAGNDWVESPSRVPAGAGWPSSTPAGSWATRPAGPRSAAPAGAAAGRSTPPPGPSCCRRPGCSRTPGTSSASPTPATSTPSGSTSSPTAAWPGCGCTGRSATRGGPSCGCGGPTACRPPRSARSSSVTAAWPGARPTASSPAGRSWTPARSPAPAAPC